MNFLFKYIDYIYALMRIAAGFMFAFHGFQKIFGILGGLTQVMGTQLWFGGLIELTAGLMIMVGCRLTSWAAFIASGTMAVAYIQHHWQFQFGSGFFPTINKGELALLYSLVFLYISVRNNKKWFIVKGK